MGKFIFHEELWYSTLTRPVRTRVTSQSNAGRYCISPCDARVAARRVPGCRDDNGQCYRPWMSFDVSRRATCVVFVRTGADIGETTSRPFIPQWRLNTSERAAVFPRYYARVGRSRETREREMDEESHVVAAVSVSQTGFSSREKLDISTRLCARVWSRGT